MPPKPSCDCGKCLKCCYRTVKRAARAKPLKRSPIKRGSPPKRTAMQTRKMAVKVKRRKPRKVSVLRDPGYLKFLRLHCPCIISGWSCDCGTVEAAHGPVNGMSSKGADSEAVPLGRGHHREQHQVGWPEFERKYNFDRQREAAAHYLAYTIWKEVQ